MTQQPNDHSFRYRMALVSYWLLFVFLPLGGFVAWRGLDGVVLKGLLPLFLVLILVAEHAFRPWKRLWRVR